MASINQLVVMLAISLLIAGTLGLENKWSKKKKQAAIKLKLTTAYCQPIGHGCYKCKDPSRGSNYERCYDDQDSALLQNRSRRQAAGYRFDNDKFEASSTGDGCKRVRRNSMLCMVCKDPKSNAKYEQCSYVMGMQQEPHKSTQDTSRGKQRTRMNSKSSSDDDDEDEDEDKEGHSSHHQTQTYQYPKGNSYETPTSTYYEEEKHGGQSAPSRNEAGCKKVQKDGESCTVCTDPSTGAKSESCNYAFEPKDKAYAYTKSKSFGYPHEDEEEEESPEKLAGSSVEDDDESHSAAEEDYGSLDYIRSESEKISQKVGAANCREERRDDSMLCRICKDPRTGDDHEHCNYSYEPTDSDDDYQESQLHRTLYPHKQESNTRLDNDFDDASRRRAEIEKIVEDMKLQDRANCSKIYRDGMTCFSCKDDKGFRNEECVFVTDPEP